MEGKLTGSERLQQALKRELRRATKQLRQSEARFGEIFRLAPIGITISTLAEGRFIDMNEAGERLSGYSRDEVIGRTAYDFQIWKSPEVRRQVLEEIMRKGEVRDREMIMRDKSGRIFWGSYSGVIVEIDGVRHLLSLVSDIGERKKAQEAIRESEERFRLLADTAPVLIWEAGRDSRCTYLNKTWLEFTGKSVEEVAGDGWEEGVHPDDLNSWKEAFRAAYDDGRRFSMEYRLRRFDGEYGWVVDTAVPRRSREGEVIGYIGTGFDVTEKKRTEEALQKSNELLAETVAEQTAQLRQSVERLQAEINERTRIDQALQSEINERLTAQAELREKELLLQHQSRLAAMGEMIGNIAHQWRQPLNTLSLLVQELAVIFKRGECDDQYLDNCVKKMLEAIRHMSHTIDDFRDFFRPMKEKVDFKVLEVIGKTISLLEGTLKTGQIRTEVLAQKDETLHGFPNEFSQVLLNLIINARDAFAANQTPSPAISIEVGCNEHGCCVVTVTDNAGGIPEEIMDRIFDPYFTTKGPEKGSGVGLFMSRNIVEKSMGGRITVRNVDGGAQFRIEVGALHLCEGVKGEEAKGPASGEGK